MTASLPPLAGEEHVCTECRISYASIDVATALTLIQAVPGLVTAALEPIPVALVRRRPDATTWSVLEYACHLRDVHAVYTIRLYRARVEDTPTLEPMLNDLRAARFRYNHRDAASVVAEIADNVVGLTEEVATYSGDMWARVVRRLPAEERTALWMLRQVAHEGVHHLQDIASVRCDLEHLED